MPIRSTGWCLVLRAPLSEVLAPVRALRVLVLSSLVLLSLLVLAASVWMGNSMSRPIAAVVEGMGRIARGDLSVRLEVRSSLREVSDLVSCINGTTEAMRRSVLGILDASQVLLSKAQDVSSSAEEVAAGASEVASMAGRVSSNVQDTVAAIEETTAGVNEVSLAAQEGAKGAMGAGEEAEAISHLAQMGGRSVEEMAALMGRMSESGRAVSSAIEDLASSVGQISGFVSTISQIADQTNLLALNAAIEAARAGEAGKGFAVVAEEVRKLAEESNQAAAQVSGLIDQVTSKTRGALEHTRSSGEQLEAVVAKTYETRDVILDVVQKVGAISDRVRSIASAMEEQSASAEEMNAGMDSISRSSQEVAEQTMRITQTMEEQRRAVEALAGAAEELLSLSESLRSSVSAFKVRGESEGGLVPLGA